MALRARRVVAVFLAVAGLAPAFSLVAETDCTVPGENLFVRNTLQDIYFWYRELPDPNPALFDSPEAYLEAVRYRALDTTFSYLASKQADSAFFSDSQFIGFGLSTRLDGTDDLRVTQVFPDSPASEAGLLRGDRLLEIGGRSVADVVAGGDLDTAFGPSQIGVRIEVWFRNGDGREVKATMTKRLVTIPTVSLTQVHRVDGRRVGYILFRNFVQPSTAALDGAFRVLRQRGATELVLDLRYNGGGFVSVAQHLAGLIGGANTSGQVFVQFVHNDKNAFRNQALYFDEPANALSLSRLVVITTHASASASELVINALRPFIPVVVIGSSTYGKPVGQYGFDFCLKVLHPVAFTLRNASGQGDYFQGFPPDCAAVDDLEHGFGDPAEASLAEALHYLRTGACSGASTVAAQAIRRPAPRLRQSGFRELLGAY